MDKYTLVSFLLIGYDESVKPLVAFLMQDWTAEELAFNLDSRGVKDGFYIN